MTRFEQLQPFLARATRGERLTPPMMKVLRDLRAELDAPDVAPLASEAAAQRETVRSSLCAAADMLIGLGEARPQAALEAACTLLPLPLAADPFGGALYRLAEQVAGQLGDAALQQRFATRYRSYLDRFSEAQALLGLSDLLLDAALGDTLEAACEHADEAGGRGRADVVPFTSAPSVSPYASFSSTGREIPARAYVVQVRKLTDPRVAQFAIFQSTLVDLTDGGALGREDARGRLHADLVLDFDRAQDLLRSLEPDDLALRLVFHGSGAAEGFSVGEHTLFDVEVVPDEGRLYFKLLVPDPWVAAGVPLGAIWPNVESVVLLSNANNF